MLYPVKLRVHCHQNRCKNTIFLVKTNLTAFNIPCELSLAIIYP
jgi:hypothetical protein